MALLPLITHESAASIIAWRDGNPITAARFLLDVRHLSSMLPDGRHMLNACTDRYRFTVGLAAALVKNKVSLLPSTQTTETIRQMREFAPDAFCLTDSKNCSIALPQIQYPEFTDVQGSDEESFTVPQIDSEQLVAYVFTSGSTGVPVPHRKTWGALVRNVQVEAKLCALNDGRQHVIIGTVPPQHMYGFESTVLIVLQSGNALWSAPYFYPADICNAIQSAPRPRALVSTPVHMRSVMSADLDVPPVDLIVSATAPLSNAFAEELEAGFQSPLLEIYGSTETGQIAVRYPTRSQEWTLFDGVTFNQDGSNTWAFGGHIEQPTLMNDVIECVGERRFVLHGRMADLINIAGKRNSLAYLNLQLTSIPGVKDGAFFMPDEVEADGVTRLMAFVVAPELTANALMAALREKVDSVFLPRPLVFVDMLPRNATGKLPREALKALALEKVKAGGTA
jgi:acyl-coenzyme A synthetase/AMP-(fatty) acid ligase